VRELRRHVDTPLETGRDWSLPLQRLRPLLQDERPESTPHQAEATPGKYLSCLAAVTDDERVRTSTRLNHNAIGDHCSETRGETATGR